MFSTLFWLGYSDYDLNPRHVRCVHKQGWTRPKRKPPPWRRVFVSGVVMS